MHTIVVTGTGIDVARRFTLHLSRSQNASDMSEDVVLQWETRFDPDEGTTFAL